MRNLGVIFLLLCTTAPLFGGEVPWYTLSARHGAFRLLSADVMTPNSYHFVSSLEYFQQQGLLDDESTNNSTVKRTKGMLGFGYALNDYLHISLSGGILNSSSTAEPLDPSSSAGTLTYNLLKGGVAVDATYDMGSKLFSLSEQKLVTGLSLWMDVSKLSRFFKGPNIIPTWMLTYNSRETVVPFRAHLNTGFRLSNSARFFDSSTSVDSFDRFSTESIESSAITVATGIEFPMEVINPSLEFHMEKTFDSGFSESPKWVTVGAKGKPFAQKNVDLFGAADIGLSSFSAPATNVKPDVPPVPLWNIVLGFTVSEFGRKDGEVGVDRQEYERTLKELDDREKQLQTLKSDLQYNTIRGTVIDAITREPLPEVRIAFPDQPSIQASLTAVTGQFLRYFPWTQGIRVEFSKEGYDTSSKYIALTPGEALTIDIEMKRTTGEQRSDLVISVATEEGSPVVGKINLINTDRKERYELTTDEEGKLKARLPAGNYKLSLVAEGFSELTEELSLEKGQTTLRTYTVKKP